MNRKVVHRLVPPDDVADGPRIRMTCEGCGYRMPWYPEIARRNLELLKGDGSVDAEGRIRIACSECGHVNHYRIPNRPVPEPFSGGRL